MIKSTHSTNYKQTTYFLWFSQQHPSVCRLFSEHLYKPHRNCLKMYQTMKQGVLWWNNFAHVWLHVWVCVEDIPLNMHTVVLYFVWCGQIISFNRLKYASTHIFFMLLHWHRGNHDDVIKWKHFPRYWPFVWGIHRSPVNSHTKASDAELWCFVWSASE